MILPTTGNTAPDQPTPSKIGPYPIIRELGRGGMGVVYLAEDPRLGRHIALKTLPDDLIRDQGRRARLEREARILASVTHPNIATVYSLEETDATAILTMEYVRGETLERLVRKGPLTLNETWQICHGMVLALGALHTRRVVHRDLKPANVMRNDDGETKVLDFGLARAFDSSAAVAGEREIAGTPPYMSPEQLRGGAVNARSDLWALGCIAFECLAGCRPFDADTVKGLLQLATTQSPNWALLSECDPVMRRLIEGCLQPNPDERPRDAHQLSVFFKDRPTSSPLTRDLDSASILPSARSARVGQWIPLRVRVDNPSPEPWQCPLDLEYPPNQWQVDRPTVLEIPARESRSAVVWARPTLEGRLHIPRVKSTRRSDPASGHTSSPVLLIRPRDVSAGLQSELREVRNWLERGEQVFGSALRVRGCLGGGKTHFLEQLRSIAGELRWRTIVVSARGSRGEPRKVFHDLLRRLLDIAEGEHTDASLRLHSESRLAEYFGPDSAHTTELVNALVGAHDTTMGQETEQFRWFWLVSAVAQEGPLLWLIDDIDELSSEVPEMIRGVLERCSQSSVPFAAVLTQPSEAPTRRSATPPPGWLRRCPEVQLAPLGATEMLELIESHYPGATVRDDLPWLPECLLSRASGNVAFALELLRSLATEGKTPPVFARSGDQRWCIGERPSRSELLKRLPRQPNEALLEQLQGISVDTRGVVEFAALLGIEFDIDPLESVVSRVETLDTALDELEALQWLTPVNDNLSRYRFQNQLIIDAVLESMQGRGRRQTRARRVALADALPDSERELIGRLLLDAGRVEDAFPCLLEAVGERIRRGHYASAEDLFDRLRNALESSPDLSEASQVSYWLARTECSLGQNDVRRALGSLARAKELAGATSLAQSVEARCLLKLAEIETRQGRLREAQTHLNAVMPLADQLGDSSLKTSAWINQAIVHRHRRETSQAHAVLTKLVDEFETTAVAPRSRTAILSNLGAVCFDLGRHDEAHNRFRSALDSAIESGNMDAERIVRMGISNLAYARGEFDQARNGYAAAHDVCRKLQNRRGLARCYENIAETEKQRGDLSAAKVAVERALAIRAEIGDQLGEMRSHYLSATISELRNDLIECERELGLSRDIARQLEDSAYELQCELTMLIVVEESAWHAFGAGRTAFEAPVGLGDIEAAPPPRIHGLALAFELVQAHRDGVGVDEATHERVVVLLQDLERQRLTTTYCRLARAWSRVAPLRAVLDTLGSQTLPNSAPLDWVWLALAQRVESEDPVSSREFRDRARTIISERARRVPDRADREDWFSEP